MSNLIAPFVKLDEAECFNCRYPIRVYSNETDDIKLSKEGVAIDTSVVSFKLIGVCPKCGALYKVKRQGIGFSITSDERELFYLGGKDNGETKKDGENQNEFGYVPTDNR